MAEVPSPRVAQALIDLLRRHEDAIIARWKALLKAVQPNLYASLEPGVWGRRVEDALQTLQRELTQPARLRYPVFSGRSGSGHMIELAERAVAAHLAEELELYEFQGAYFLLQEVLIEVIRADGWGDDELSAVMLVDRFIKQLSVAISMAITADRTDALERAVSARTAHLDQLLKKQDEFVSFVSHEIRTGLTAILGACDFLTDISDQPLSAEQDRFVRIIERSGALINVLVNDILDYAKLEAGRVSLRLEPVHLRETAMDAIALLEAKWAPKGLEMVLAIAPELPEVAGDRIRLQQVYLNLLANAIRFSPEFGTITLRGGRHGREVWVEVEDHGPGVPTRDRKRIFERFQQLDHDLNRRQGTGLGLPIVKLLVEMHGGRVSLRDTPGGGSTFRVTLPAIAGTNEQPPHAALARERR